MTASPSSCAVLLGHLEGAEGMGVGIARTAGDEQCNGAGVVGLDAVLGVAGEVGVDLHHVGAERGVVAGVAEDDGQRLAAGVLDPQDRHALVGRAGGVLAQLDPLGGRLAAVQGEVGAADPVAQAGRLHLADRLADQVDDLVFQLPRVGDVVLEALARWIVRVRAVSDWARSAWGRRDCATRTGRHPRAAIHTWP